MLLRCKLPTKPLHRKLRHQAPPLQEQRPQLHKINPEFSSLTSLSMRGTSWFVEGLLLATLKADQTHAL